MADSDGGVTLCCLLWANEGEAGGLTAYEDSALALIASHGGQIIQRAQSDGSNDSPNEVQLLRFTSRASLDSYLADSRRTLSSRERDRVIKRTQVFPVRSL